MTQEQKDLLLKDLCVRLPYGVKLKNLIKADSDIEATVKLYSINLESCCTIRFYTYEGKALTICKESRLFRPGYFLRYKPYLFPLSSITEEQSMDLFRLFGVSLIDSIDADYIKINECTGITFFFNKGFDVETHLDKLIEWLNKNHFDYRGLIEKGLAINATGLNIY